MADDAGTHDRDIAAAIDGDPDAFERLVFPYRRELLAHCYRMLGSPHDAEDGVQDALLAAWRGLRTFEGRSTLRAWLYRICTNACLRLIDKRPRRILTPDHGPSFTQTRDLGEPVTGPVWVEPLVDLPAGDDTDPWTQRVRREDVELAFVAALQHLPGTQRAVLILREVMDFSAAETARMLDTTTTSVNSALQRARKTLDQRLTGPTQAGELAKLGDEGIRDLVAAFVNAWERADVEALVGLLAEDAVFTMPPLPAWFDGRDAVAMFVAERLFAQPWRLVPTVVNGQLGFACYMLDRESRRFRLGAVNAVSVRNGRISAINGFVDPDVVGRIGLPLELPGGNPSPPR